MSVNICSVEYFQVNRAYFSIPVAKNFVGIQFTSPRYILFPSHTINSKTVLKSIPNNRLIEAHFFRNRKSWKKWFKNCNFLKYVNTVHFQIQNHLKINWASIRHLELEIDFSKIAKNAVFFSAKSQVLYLLHFSIQKPEGGATF